ncbi:hypothetical protein G6F56_011395 [Rhizopus delemar]|nr:hypothetical protein G6F56_011395 [Rhizopus delemar]
MEIDADITNTPLPQEYKPNTQLCKAYTTSDFYHLDRLQYLLSKQSEFRATDELKANDMLHIVDQEKGGEIFAFSNGSLSFWGLEISQQEKFLGYIRDSQEVKVSEKSESVEFTVDEDEVTDMKGDVILLNPYNIQLSKLAFSYGLGRAAKVASVEADFDGLMLHMSDDTQLLSKTVYSRFFKNAQDGFLGTAELNWSKAELKGIHNVLFKC